MNTVLSLYNDFMLSRRLADLSEKSIEDYGMFLKPFLDFVGGARSLDNLTPDIITAYLFSVVSRPLSKATRATYIRNAKIFLKWVSEEQDVLYDYNKIKIPKCPKRSVRIYSPEDIQLVFDSACVNVPWLSLRNKAIIALMYDSGLRQSEVCGLLWSNISFAENRMIVRGKGNKERTVPLGHFTRYYLLEYQKYCPYDMPYVFCARTGDPLSCNAVKLFMHELAKRLPFPLSSHKLRHNFATNYCLDQYEKRGAVDIYRLMILMGHENIETTERYLHFAYEVIAARDSISHLDNIYKIG